MFKTNGIDDQTNGSTSQTNDIDAQTNESKVNTMLIFKTIDADVKTIDIDDQNKWHRRSNKWHHRYIMLVKTMTIGNNWIGSNKWHRRSNKWHQRQYKKGNRRSIHTSQSTSHRGRYIRRSTTYIRLFLPPVSGEAFDIRPLTFVLRP